MFKLEINHERQQNINLKIQYLDEDTLKLPISFFNLTEQEEFSDLLSSIQEKPAEREQTLLEVNDFVRSRLDKISTVGHILDALNFCIKCMFINKSSHDKELDLLVEIFQLMPETFTYDPVKIHMITKLIHEIVAVDSNNAVFFINKIISINKLSFYVAITLWWSIFMHLFKKDAHYFKMNSVAKFTSLLQTINPYDQNMSVNEFFQLLLLLSIYQNHVILNKRNQEGNLSEEHHLFKDFFKVSDCDKEYLGNWLTNAKIHYERTNPSACTQSEDAIMLLELLELDMLAASN